MAERAISKISSQIYNESFYPEFSVVLNVHLLTKAGLTQEAVMIFYLVFAIIVAILFYKSAKKYGLPPAKWGWIGFGGGLVSCLVLVVIWAVVNTQLFRISRYIDGPGYVIFPLSAVVMFLVYRKWLHRPEHEKHAIEPE